jgi:hypothetical protein
MSRREPTDHPRSGAVESAGVRNGDEPNRARKPSRVVIEHMQPQIDGGRFPVKRTVGEALFVTADVFADGHDLLDEARYTWQGEWNYVKLDPAERMAHIFVIRTRVSDK